MKRKKQRGFTLIEVLIASAIVMASMGLMMNLFSSGLDRMHRVGSHAHQIIVEKEINNRLNTTNFARQSEGIGNVEGWSYLWKATQIEGFSHVSEMLGEIPYPRYVALFAIDITIESIAGKKIHWTVKRLGWQDTP